MVFNVWHITNTGCPYVVHFVQKTQAPRDQGHQGLGHEGMGTQGDGLRGKCYGCGLRDHMAKSPKCPAKNSKCTFCHKSRHWETVCFTKQKSNAAAKLHEVSELGSGANLQCIQCTLRSVFKPTPRDVLFTDTIQLRDLYTDTLHTLMGEIDSGSYCSVISCCLFDDQLSLVHLHAVQHPSFAFGGVPVTGFEGTFSAVISANGRECSVNMVVCSANITPLIGRNIINGLEVSFTRSSSALVVSSSSSMLARSDSGILSSLAMKHYEVSSVAQPSLHGNYTILPHEFSTLTLNQLGGYPRFQHRIQLHPGTIPIVSHMRPVPLALREKMESAVRELDHQGIWEPVDESERALCLITSIKPMGGVHITTDFSLLNTSVILSCYSLLLPEDFLQATKGSSFISKLSLIKGSHQIELHPHSRKLMATFMLYAHGYIYANTYTCPRD